MYMKFARKKMSSKVMQECIILYAASVHFLYILIIILFPVPINTYVNFVFASSEKLFDLLQIIPL